MYVLEHIGLGRYGDPLSATGTEDAAKEIARIVRAGGAVVFSLPVGTRSVTEFNANRRFTYDEARSLFPDWLLVEECLLIPASCFVLSGYATESVRSGALSLLEKAGTN